MTQLPHSPFLACIRQAATRAGVLENVQLHLRPGILTAQCMDSGVSVDLTVTGQQAGEAVANKSSAREWAMYLDNLLRKQRNAATDAQTG